MRQKFFLYLVVLFVFMNLSFLFTRPDKQYEPNYKVRDTVQKEPSREEADDEFLMPVDMLKPEPEDHPRKVSDAYRRRNQREKQEKEIKEEKPIKKEEKPQEKPKQEIEPHPPKNQEENSKFKPIQPPKDDPSPVKSNDPPKPEAHPEEESPKDRPKKEKPLKKEEAPVEPKPAKNPDSAPKKDKPSKKESTNESKSKSKSQPPKPDELPDPDFAKDEIDHMQLEGENLALKQREEAALRAKVEEAIEEQDKKEKEEDERLAKAIAKVIPQVTPPKKDGPKLEPPLPKTNRPLRTILSLKPKKPKSVPKYCMLVRTYEKHKNALVSLMASLHRMNYPNMKVYMVNTDKNEWPTMNNFFKDVQKVLGRDFVEVLPMGFDAITERFPNFVKPDYGYVLTDIAMDWIMQNTECEYLTITNGDNWYPPTMLDVLLPWMEQETELIGFQFISHYRWGSHDGLKFPPQVVRAGHDNLVLSRFAIGEIDLGASVVRLDTIRRLDHYFVLNDLLKDPVNGGTRNFIVADGAWYEGLLAANVTQAIIPRCLFFHQ